MLATVTGRPVDFNRDVAEFAGAAQSLEQQLRVAEPMRDATNEFISTVDPREVLGRLRSAMAQSLSADAAMVRVFSLKMEKLVSHTRLEKGQYTHVLGMGGCRGGVAQSVTLEPEYERTAVMAAQIMGLRVAGVDMLESKSGPQVMEVNSSPGLEGIESATGVDIAGEIIRHVEEQVQFPDLDIRQRLTLDRGYGVAEVPIGPESSLVGKSIKESGLRDQDVLVLSIIRESQTIPNPRMSREILSGDRLLCYGKLLAMKTLFPTQNWPKPKKAKK